MLLLPAKSVPGSDGIEGVLHIPQISSIIGASPWDCSMSYRGHSLRGGVGGLTPPQRCSRCILQLQPTEPASILRQFLMILAPNKSWRKMFFPLLSEALWSRINSWYSISFSNVKQKKEKKNTTLLLVELLAVTWAPYILRQPILSFHHHHHHHHHYVLLTAQSSLTLSPYPSLSSIAPGRSSRLHPVSVQNWCKYLLVDRHCHVHV